MFARDLFRSGVVGPAAATRAFSARAAKHTAPPAGYDPLRTLFTSVLVAVGAVYAMTTHIDVKIDTLCADVDNKFDNTNNKIDALGAEVRSAFNALRNDMRSFDDKLEQLRGRTHVLQSDVGRLMDVALRRQQQQQQQQPPPSASNK